MNKKNTKSNTQKMNKKTIGIIAVATIIIVVLIIICVVLNNKVSDKHSKVSGKLNTGVWLNVNQDLTFKNGEDNLTLKINSDLKYQEGAEYEVPYSLTINDIEYTGTYTFATGYSIHSEPNNIPYSVSFVGIKEGSIGVMVSKNNQDK